MVLLTLLMTVLLPKRFGGQYLFKLCLDFHNESNIFESLAVFPTFLMLF